jgi:hypothetical protein
VSLEEKYEEGLTRGYKEERHMKMEESDVSTSQGTPRIAGATRI